MKKTITIAPLSIPEALTMSAWNAIRTASTLYLQTREHPSAKPVLEASLSFVSMDDLYAKASDYDELNAAIADRLTSGSMRSAPERLTEMLVTPSYSRL